MAEKTLTAEECLVLTSTVTTEPSTTPLVIKDHIFPESVSQSCSEELSQLLTQSDLLQPSKMGFHDNNWQNKLFRGDQTCWITPSLCRERNMVGVRAIIQHMMKICSQLREFSREPQALKDFSVQFAVYVCSSKNPPPSLPPPFVSLSLTYGLSISPSLPLFSVAGQ
jgi:hypothetical protein